MDKSTKIDNVPTLLCFLNVHLFLLLINHQSIQ